MAGYAKFFLILRGKTDILLVAELGTEFDSDNWLHFQSVVTQWVGEERVVVDTKMDTNLARRSESFQNAGGMPPVPANARDPHFITIKVMKRYRLVYRGIRNAYYSFDTHTKRRESLGTGNADEAQRLVDTKNEAVHHAEMNLQIAQVYLQHSDPSLAARTWQHVMEKVVSLKTGSTRERWEHAVDDKAFDLIRHRKLLQTTSEHFLTVLNHGSVSTNV